MTENHTENNTPSQDIEERTLHIANEDVPKLERIFQTPEFRQVISASFSGPIPPPGAMQGYKEVQEDAPERILRMAEKEQDHRHECDKKALQATIDKDKRGQNYGLGLALSFGAMAFILALLGHDILAGTIMTIDIIGLVGVFALGRYKPKSKEVPPDDTTE